MVQESGIMHLLTKRRNMELALKLLLFFIGMALSMVGIMTSLHAPEHMVLGVLIFFSGFVILFSSFTPNH
jgi:uncharacterized membrane protein YfcA